MGSISEKYEKTLNRAETSLREARELYESVSRTESIPEAFIQAIRELDQQIEELSKETSVTDSRLEHASETYARANLLKEALDAFQHQQHLLVKGQVERLATWVEAFQRAERKHRLNEDLQTTITELGRHVTILKKLLEAGQFANVVENKRVTPAGLENELRTTDAELRAQLDSAAYSQVCLGCFDDLIDRIHQRLQTLDDENPEKTQFSDYLRAAKQHKGEAQKSLDKGNYEQSAREARIALEGALMTDSLLARAEADQEFAQALGGYLCRHDFAANEEVQPLVEKADTEALLDEVVTAIGSEVELSVEERLQHLLEETGGSVERAAAQSDMDIETLLDHVTNLYLEGDVTDIIVKFDQ